MDKLTENISLFYQQIKGVIMTTVNEKLVHLNPNSLANNLKPIYQLEEIDKDELETLQTNFEALEMRVNFLETNTVQPLKNQLQAIEKRTAKQILAMSIIGAIGFTSLGLWVEVKTNSSFQSENVSNLSKADESYQP